MTVPIKWIIKYNEENETVFVLEKSNRVNWMQWRHEYVDKA